MKTATRGNAGEAMILADLVDLGFEVLVPFGSGHSYDLAIDLGSEMVRVQCKTAWLDQRCVRFNCRTTDHGHGRRSYVGLADVFGRYFPPSKSAYLVPVSALPGFQGRLRLEPARNNQQKGVKHAADYALERWSAEALRRICREARILNDG